jgi:hypothetical protein
MSFEGSSFENQLIQNPESVNFIGGLRSGSDIWLPINCPSETISVGLHELGHILADYGLLTNEVMSPVAIRRLTLPVSFKDRAILLSQLWSINPRPASKQVKETIVGITKVLVKEFDFKTVNLHYDIPNDTFHELLRKGAKETKISEQIEQPAFDFEFAGLRTLCNTLNLPGIPLYPPPRVRYPLESATSPHARAQKIAWIKFFG